MLTATNALARKGAKRELDLNHFLECEHLIQLERQRDPGAGRSPREPHADLLAEKGAAHEQAWLGRFRAEGKAVVTIGAAGRDRDWAADAERTAAALRNGAAVLDQAVFADDEWRGVADFLVRVEQPSALGSWSYEAWDTKLARHTKRTMCQHTTSDTRVHRRQRFPRQRT